MTNPKRISLLMSDTGGGHRASAEAIQEALLEQANEPLHIELVDIFRQYTPFPYKNFPEIYPLLVAYGKRIFWEPTYRLSDGFQRARIIATLTLPTLWRGMRHFAREVQSDLFVCLHPLILRPVLHGLQHNRPPFVTVVTDLVSTHAFWYHREADLTIVPTVAAFEQGLRYRMPAHRMKVIGLPVAQKFSKPQQPQAQLRSELGWHLDLPTVLVIGGGDGMGPLREIAQHLANLAIPLQLVVVCGRNETLREQLAAQTWQNPTHIYGFMRNMPELMTAADLVVTKAGPSSIVEALNCGKPLVLSSAIPGQEDGNVLYITQSGAGVWAPTPNQVAAAVTELLQGGAMGLHAAAARARQLAMPNAASEIAQQLLHYLELLSTPNIPS